MKSGLNQPKKCSPDFLCFRRQKTGLQVMLRHKFMKNSVYSIIAIVLFAFNGFSQTQPIKEFHLIYADWDEWGRTSRGCKGFGLCHFRSCTFCCTQGDVIVSCHDKTRVPNSGIIKIDKETNQGFLTISLDSSIEEQKDAINNKETLYLDTDLYSENIILYKGDYEFDTSVGKYGGYIVKAGLK